MIGTLRIAMAYFSALSLQRWTNSIGLALMVIALAIRAVSHGRAAFETSAMLVMFGGLLLLLPLAVGGGMMRAASTRIILHLHPRGRLQMLIGATLAVTLIATGVTLMLVLALNPQGIEGVSAPPWSRTPPLTVFATAWSVVAMVWLVVFIATGDRLLSFLIGFVPLALIRFGRTVFGAMPDASVMFILSVAAWTGFALWYLRAPSIRRLVYSRTRLEEANDNPLRRFFLWANGAHSSPSRSRAADQYLLGMTPLGHVLLGVVLILGTALLQFVFSSSFAGTPDLVALQFMAPLVFLPVVYISWGAMSFALTRRARILWLRSGMDRMALFRQVERSGMVGAMLSFGLLMIAIMLHSLARWPAQADAIVVFLVVQIPFLVCLFYVGLSLTRGWTAQDVLLCLGLCVLLAGEAFLLQPWSGHQSSAAPLVFVALLMLALLLRWHARRRWRGLDWRVARLLQMPARA
jgi:hypothetical protein